MTNPYAPGRLFMFANDVVEVVNEPMVTVRDAHNAEAPFRTTRLSNLKPMNDIAGVGNNAVPE